MVKVRSLTMLACVAVMLYLTVSVDGSDKVAAEDDDLVPEIVPLLQLLVNPDLYHGKDIVTEGFLDLGRTPGIYLSESAADNSVGTQAIALEYSELVDNQRERYGHRTFQPVRGRFYYSGKNVVSSGASSIGELQSPSYIFAKNNEGRVRVYSHFELIFEENSVVVTLKNRTKSWLKHLREHQYEGLASTIFPRDKKQNNEFVAELKDEEGRLNFVLFSAENSVLNRFSDVELDSLEHHVFGKQGTYVMEYYSCVCTRGNCNFMDSMGILHIPPNISNEQKYCLSARESGESETKMSLYQLYQ